jgi:hypothetical protein
MALDLDAIAARFKRAAPRPGRRGGDGQRARPRGAAVADRGSVHAPRTGPGCPGTGPCGAGAAQPPDAAAAGSRPWAEALPLDAARLTR